MMRSRWRELAFGLVAATLSVGIAACDDDTTTVTTGDMAVGGDMSASVGDMAGATPGNGQVTLGDVVGTVFSPGLPGGSARRTHQLVAIANFSKFAGTPDPSSDLTLGPPPHGCSVARYDFAAGKVPGADADAGNVSLSGYDNAHVFGTDTKTGITAPPQASITCVRGGPLMTYSCFYGTMPNLTDGGSAGMGALSGDVIYAPIPAPAPASPPKFGCPGSVLAAGAAGPFFCEQYPIPNGGFSVINETVTGGADYPATSPSTVMIGSGKGEDAGAAGLGDQVTIVSVKSGATEISGLDPVSGSIVAGTNGCPASSVNGCQRNLDLTDAMVDKTKDLTIQWSCDGSQTAGMGCASSDFLGVLLTTSANAKSAFSSPQSTAFGVGQCVELVARTDATATVKAAQLQALLGTQAGGSIQIAVVRLGYSIKPSGSHLLIYTAGHGQFGFTNLP